MLETQTVEVNAVSLPIVNHFDTLIKADLKNTMVVLVVEQTFSNCELYRPY